MRRRLEIAAAWFLVAWLAYPFVGGMLELLPGAPDLVFPGPAGGWLFLIWVVVLIGPQLLKKQLFRTILTKPPSR